MKNKRIFTFIIKGIARLLPNHIKRMVLWTSIYSQLRHTAGKKNPVSKIEAEKFNSVMSLCVQSDAMTIPLALAPLIWPDMQRSFDIVKKSILPRSTSVMVPVHEFIESVPEYLRYSNGNLIEKDLDRMLTAAGSGF